MKTHNPNCDGSHCTATDGKVAILPLPGNANLFLCKACWVYEMRWRRERNQELAEDARYPVLVFPEECA